jgi:uncharacterized protein
VRVIKGHPGIGGPVRGTALVARDGFSARYDLDRIRGVFARPTHKLHGQSYVGRILVLDQAKGGVATAWMLHEMAARRMAPLALLLNRANPVMAQGAALAGVTLMDRFEGDVTALVPNGATLEVDPAGGRVTILDA